MRIEKKKRMKINKKKREECEVVENEDVNEKHLRKTKESKQVNIKDK
jgi:hypothetical protein